MHLVHIDRRCLLALLWAGLGCDSPTEPLREAELFPEITAIEPDASRLVDGGIVALVLRPTDTDFRLARHAYVPASIRASSGDVEALRARPRICWTAIDSRALCRYFFLGMDEGHDVRQIADLLREFNARIALIAPNGRIARVHPFNDRSATMWLVRKFDGVHGVSDIAVGTIDDGPSAGDAALQVAVPFDIGSWVPGDGVLTAAVGDTVTFEYTSSSGVLSAFSFIVPSP